MRMAGRMDRKGYQRDLAQVGYKTPMSTMVCFWASGWCFPEQRPVPCGEGGEETCPPIAPPFTVLTTTPASFSLSSESSGRQFLPHNPCHRRNLDTEEGDVPGNQDGSPGFCPLSAPSPTPPSPHLFGQSPDFKWGGGGG